jgi:hypothetical protein
MIISMALAGTALAQTSSTIIDQARATGSTPSLLGQPAASGDAASSTAAPKLSGDDEFGEQIVLARRANWDPWTIAFDTEFYFTDNVALASTGSLSDTYLRTGAQLRYTNRISGDWFLNAGVDDHVLLHGKYDTLDFMLLKADAGLMYRAPWLADTFFTFGYLGYWVTEPDFQTGAFQNHSLTLGAQRVIKIARAMQLVLGTAADYSAAALPAEPQRHDYSAYMAYRLRVSEKVHTTAMLRTGYFDYPFNDRQDWNFVLALGASYDLTPWLRLQLSASGTLNRSSIHFYHYESFSAGGSVVVHLEF